MHIGSVFMTHLLRDDLTPLWADHNPYPEMNTYTLIIPDNDKEITDINILSLRQRSVADNVLDACKASHISHLRYVS